MFDKSFAVSCCLIAALGSAAASRAGTTTFGTEIENLVQASPADAVASQQVLIIENDANGNQRILQIGSPGGTVTGFKPCQRDTPTPAMNCTGQDLRGVQWNGAQLSGSLFDEADLTGASLRGGNLENTSFNDARLGHADLSGAVLVNSDFNNARLSGARLVRARVINTDFIEADLTYSDLSGASVVNTEFMASRLRGAVWLDGRTCGRGSVGRCTR
jgi:uncharacterized protein YjbI with pentapeptide repeats